MLNEERAKELVCKCLESMREYEKVDVYNEYCDKNKCYDDKIYPMYELEDYIGDLSQYTIGDLFGRFQMEDFNFDDAFFRDTIYGIESANYVECWMETDELVDYIVEHEDCLGNKDIEEALLEADEDEDEEEAE
jgi:hypothetical protein